MLSEDGMIEDDNSKHVSSTFRGVYKRRYDTKWRAEITAGTNPHPNPFAQDPFSSNPGCDMCQDTRALSVHGVSEC